MRSIQSIMDEIATEATEDHVRARIYAEELKEAAERMSNRLAQSAEPPATEDTERCEEDD